MITAKSLALSCPLYIRRSLLPFLFSFLTTTITIYSSHPIPSHHITSHHITSHHITMAPTKFLSKHSGLVPCFSSFLAPPLKTPPLLKVHHGKVMKRSKLVTPIRILEPRGTSGYMSSHLEVDELTCTPNSWIGDEEDPTREDDLGEYRSGLGLVPSSFFPLDLVHRVRQPWWLRLWWVFFFFCLLS